VNNHQPTTTVVINAEPLHAGIESADRIVRAATAACEKCGRKPIYKTDGQSRQICRRCAMGLAPTFHKTPRPGRNDLCPCGSGLKFKKCCMNAALPKLPAVHQEPVKIDPIAVQGTVL
jgi:uncharacterized protein YecA (UPF0149 family)